MPNGFEPGPAAAISPDAALAARIAGGDRAAESELVRRYTRPLLAVLQQRVRQHEAARDLVQETFIVVLERLREGRIDEPDRLAGFLRQTAINLAIGEGRKQQRQRTDAMGEQIGELVDESAGPLRQLERQQLSGLVRRLIGELSVERDRDLLWRHYVLDTDKDELCREYALSTEHFDRVLHRARARLRELMEKNNVSH
ncbi:MAG: sigma-70 family RNA polymerase sigma factor [Tahibacter sp.]